MPFLTGMSSVSEIRTLFAAEVIKKSRFSETCHLDLCSQCLKSEWALVWDVLPCAMIALKLVMNSVASHANDFSCYPAHYAKHHSLLLQGHHYCRQPWASEGPDGHHLWSSECRIANGFTWCCWREQQKRGQDSPRCIWTRVRWIFADPLEHSVIKHLASSMVRAATLWVVVQLLGTKGGLAHLVLMLILLRRATAQWNLSGLKIFWYVSAAFEKQNHAVNRKLDAGAGDHG